MLVPTHVYRCEEQCRTKRRGHVDPCFEGAAPTTAPGQLKWIWLWGDQVCGFRRNYCPLPRLLPLFQKTLKRARGMGASQNLSLPLSCRWVSPWAAMTALPGCSVGGSFLCEIYLKLCLFLECWCFLIFPIFMSLKPAEFFSSSSSLVLIPGCSQVLSFTQTLLQNLLIIKKAIINSWKDPSLRHPALPLFLVDVNFLTS